ncbi:MULTISPECIES: glycosyltransferase family 4 protein [Gordonia]|uniref:Glycosyltransferase family 4 protein n=1 Tax=Gordonia amicalis TaxID=89053 RepID=A0AAE4U8Q9_9ACTN|nr:MULTISPECIES: glycosyltransferase family 4 protein [Gordonia]ATD73303.1 glycosyltransferase family 1 protein [Gordonia sp. 1D]MCZ0915088.1 glycosyltransferase family 4 protein [Gordonia amicalis]MCZ4578985.1 glycosyltransferase family 4 protein [Gordonia amicalis]MCZ4653352.1 glycosyltransferase family 4 protein [Gordonia amicalis]MDJ0455417.1 glycosyltransferase family 4 protein [Gordonia amicalis]
MRVPSDVLLLCWRDTRHPQGGGSETYLERVGAELARRGARVTFLTSSYPGAAGEEHRDGMRFVRAGGRISVYPRMLATILAGRFGLGPLRGCHPEVIVDTQNGVPFFATLVASAPTVVLVHHCHREQWPVAGRVLGPVGWFIESRLSPRIHRRNRYVTVSTPSKTELVALGVDAERISVVRNGIDPVPADALLTGGAADGGSGPVRLCVLSRLVPHKQVEDALTVLAQLRRSGVDVYLDVIGGGWWSDELRSAAAELGVVDAVTFHGHVSEQRKHELLSQAQVHLMPSRKEGWGLAVVEAAQHGVPTIGYRSSVGLTDSVDDGNTGLLVDGVDELVSATRKLIDNPDETQRLGRNARIRAGRYSWAATCDGFIETFDAVLAR